MRRLWLIAGREFWAYAATPSFWVALAIGPVLMAAALFASTLQHHRAPPPAIIVRADEPFLASAAVSSLAADGYTQARPARGTEAGTVRIRSEPVGGVEVTLAPGLGLSSQGTDNLVRGVERASVDRALRIEGVSAAALTAARAARVTIPAPPPAAPVNVARLLERGTSFALVTLLWLTLVGTLGMLLQAIVRERVNRALETLLASAQPIEIVFGKLIGVGAVSLLVLGAWLSGAAVLSVLGVGGSGGIASAVLHGLVRPALLLEAAGVYLVAFVMYGSAILAVGALARDLPSAQNLSRPVFGALLVVFFCALAATLGAGAGMTWLTWAPPFTPFMLLLSPQGALSPVQVALAIGLMTVSAAAASYGAARCLTVEPARSRAPARAARPG